MKSIKIFLASSIDEFRDERNDLQCFIDDVAENFRDKYETDIRVQRCEKVDPRYVKGRSQEEFNKLIRDSEMCIFLFFTKAGEYTLEEFEIARKAYEASENGKPKIYTYFKTVEGCEVENSVTDFMQRLDKNLNHFYQMFSHIDTVKLRVLLNLKLQELDFVGVEFEDGKCIVDGADVLDLSNVAEFANNGILKDLKRELEKTEKEYFELKPIYASGKADEATCRRYAAVASKRQSLIEQIEELQKSIFNISLRMCNDEMHGEISQRQKEAYRLFEIGDLDGCMAVLDSDDIDDEFFRAEKQLEEMARKNAVKYIKEHKMAIDILLSMTKYSNRFNEIELRYQKIVPVAKKYNVELDMLYDYASYLDNQGNSTKAYDIMQELFEITDDFRDYDDYEKGNCYSLFGIICYHLNKYHETEKYYLSAIEIIEKLARENPDRYSADLAMRYNNAGVFYNDQGKHERAEEYHLLAIEIREKLARENPERYNADLAGSYNNAGVFYDNQGKPERAEKYFLSAIEIREKLARENPERYNADLAMSYNNAGNFYKNQGKPERAEKYFLLAIEIYEQLARENPERYNAALAMSYNNAGVFYKNQGKPERAEKYYLLAIEIREKLARENSERYNAALATSYNNAGNFYKNQGKPERAEKYFLSAIDIREQLARENPERYNADLAVSYFNYALFHNNDREYFRKAYDLALTQPNNYYCKSIIERLKDRFSD